MKEIFEISVRVAVAAVPAADFLATLKIHNFFGCMQVEVLSPLFVFEKGGKGFFASLQVVRNVSKY